MKLLNLSDDYAQSLGDEGKRLLLVFYTGSGMAETRDVQGLIERNLGDFMRLWHYVVEGTWKTMSLAICPPLAVK